MSKLCFVTIGATASFHALIEAALEETFLKALQEAGFTNLLLQYGEDGGNILKRFQYAVSVNDDLRHGITVNGFDFNKEGLAKEMRAAKGGNNAAEGLMISHAGVPSKRLLLSVSKAYEATGSGSILAGLRINVPIVVVPNPALLDDHQAELAEELAAQGYVVHGRLRYEIASALLIGISIRSSDLPKAVKESEQLRTSEKTWPPDDSKYDPSGRGLAGIMDDEMGFVD